MRKNGCEQSRLFSPCAGADFENAVLLVEGVFRQEQNLELCFDRGKFFLNDPGLVFCHASHFRIRIGKHFSIVVEVAREFAVAPEGLDYFLEVSVRLGQLLVTILVVEDILDAELALQLLVFAFKAF